jgi:hypothetical protein
VLRARAKRLFVVVKLRGNPGDDVRARERSAASYRSSARLIWRSLAAGMISTTAITTTPVHSAQPKVWSRSARAPIGSPVADDLSRKPTT